MNKEEAIKRLNEYLKPGSNVYTILRHVSKSGMSRSISIVCVDRETNEIISLDYFAHIVLDRKIDRNNGGLKIQGAGMDMGFALVYDLGRVMYPDGFVCCDIRETEYNCKSNDHSNGEPRGKGLWHNDGGYAFHHNWL